MKKIWYTTLNFDELGKKLRKKIKLQKVQFVKIHNADYPTSTKNLPARRMGDFILHCDSQIKVSTGFDFYYENHKTSCDWSYRYYWVKWVCVDTNTLFVVPHLKNNHQRSMGSEVSFEEFIEHFC